MAVTIFLASRVKTAYREAVKDPRLTSRLRLLTATLTVPLVAQLLGLNVLCFCGGCPASQILWPEALAEEEHACCHHADTADVEPAAEVDADGPAVTGQSCCGDDHAWHPTTALAPDELTPHADAQLALLATPHLAPVTVFVPLRPVPRQTLARGPPPVPIYLANLSLQI